jgi:hypothetical protein
MLHPVIIYSLDIGVDSLFLTVLYAPNRLLLCWVEFFNAFYRVQGNNLDVKQLKLSEVVGNCFTRKWLVVPVFLD